MSHGECGSSLDVCHILWLIVNATKDSSDFCLFECSYTLKVCSYTRLSWAWFSTCPLKLKWGRFRMVFGVRFDSCYPEYASASIMRSCGVRASASIMRSCGVRASACAMRSHRVFSVLPLKLGKSGIVKPRFVMNCQSLLAPKALVKMSVVWRFVLMCWRLTSPARTRSWMNW